MGKEIFFSDVLSGLDLITVQLDIWYVLFCVFTLLQILFDFNSFSVYILKI